MGRDAGPDDGRRRGGWVEFRVRRRLRGRGVDNTPSERGRAGTRLRRARSGSRVTSELGHELPRREGRESHPQPLISNLLDYRS